MDFVLLIMGWIVTVFLSWLIARRIAAHLDESKASYTFLFVAGLALYYLVDLVLQKEIETRPSFFAFWVLLLVVEGYLYYRTRKKAKTSDKH